MKQALAMLAVTLCLLLPRVAAAEPGDELTVSVLTFGPGDHPFFKFGHNAVLVRDARTHRDAVFNFGTFSFDSPWLIFDFFKGKLKYWLSVQTLASTVAAYQRENRTIDEQELDLTPADRRAIYDALRKNALPENKYYKYDYYRDNCSTRVRDAVDTVVHGRVHDASKDKAEFTWRGHTLRLVADSLYFYLGLDAAMGDYIDKPIDQWDEMFLPSKLQESLRRAKIDNVCAPDAAPGSCGQRPLVKTEHQLLAAERAPLRTEPPPWFFRCLLVGVLLGGGLFGLGRLAKEKQSKAARVVLGVVIALIGFVMGFLGCLFLFFWLGTDHRVAWHNENILQFAPWTIALVVFGFSVAAGSPKGTERAYKLAAAAAMASLLGIVLKALPFFDQDNAQIIALTAPLWLGIAAAIQPLRPAAIASEKAA